MKRKKRRTTAATKADGRRKGEKFTRARMIAALREVEGRPNRASKVLGCSPQTVANYIARYTDVATAKREAEEAPHAAIRAELEAARASSLEERFAAMPEEMQLKEAMKILRRSPKWRPQ